MATTSYGVNHPLAVKLWSDKTFREALKKTVASRYMGKSSNALLQVLDETSKGPGDRIRTHLRMQLIGDGIQGDATLEGNEEALTVYTDDLVIDQLRHAVRSGGKMSQQRIPMSVREEARAGLEDWWADRIDTWFFNQLCGNTAVTDVRYSGLQATIAPTASHLFAAAGHDTEASLSDTTTHAFMLSDIDRAIAKAQTFTTGVEPILRPVKVGADNMYVLFIHPYVMRELRSSNTSTVGNYVDLFKAAIQGGKIDSNPIFTGAEFVYNNTVVVSDTRLTRVPGQTNRFRNVFCGAQAAFMATGREQGGTEANGMRFSWVEKLFDYDNQLGVSGGLIAGLKKTQYNSVDFSTIVISSYARTP